MQASEKQSKASVSVKPMVQKNRIFLINFIFFPILDGGMWGTSKLEWQPENIQEKKAYVSNPICWICDSWP